jgi:glutathione S-transferase
MTRILYSLCGADGRTHYSPHVWKVIMALGLKGLDFELRPVTFKQISGIEDGSFTSVPVLNDNGHLECDSFRIAVHLDESYPEKAALFSCPAARASARFAECFCQSVLHPPLSVVTVLGMHSIMGPECQVHFRSVREKRFGKTLEEIAAGRDVEFVSFREKLEPLRSYLAIHPWFGGEEPQFSDCILFGTFQWAHVTVKATLFSEDDPVADWFGRCRDLCGELAGISVAA